MIQLHHDAIVVCHPDGRVEPLAIQDLVECLGADTKAKALMLDPDLLQQIIESVVRYFRNDLQRDTVSFPEFMALARKLVKNFFEEVLKNDHDPLQLDLFETARGCGAAFELEFYLEIKRFLKRKTNLAQSETIHSVNQSPSPLSENDLPLRITGLRRCAKFLAGRRRWCKSSSKMQNEIVHYIRQEAIHTGARNMVLAILS